MHPLSEGTRVGRYVVRSRLGAGSMGVVYRAWDEEQGQEVALKVLAPDRAADRKALARFQREAQATAALRHTNIAAFRDVGQCDAGMYLAMELVQGSSLRSRMARRPTPGAWAWVGGQLARALGAAHALGVAHRDLKPENILLTNETLVKLVDFGLARMAGAGGMLGALAMTEVTTQGNVIGTVRYMSPEQARGDSVTTATDLFSLGLVLFEWATGRHPFASDFPMEVLRGIVSDAAPDSSRWRPDFPEAAHRLLRQLLDKEASCRPTAETAERILIGIAQEPSTKPPVVSSGTEGVAPVLTTTASPGAAEVPCSSDQKVKADPWWKRWRGWRRTRDSTGKSP